MLILNIKIKFLLIFKSMKRTKERLDMGQPDKRFGISG